MIHYDLDFYNKNIIRCIYNITIILHIIIYKIGEMFVKCMKNIKFNI